MVGYSGNPFVIPNFGITLTSIGTDENDQTGSGRIVENAIFNSSQSASMVPQK